MLKRAMLGLAGVMIIPLQAEVTLEDFTDGDVSLDWQIVAWNGCPMMSCVFGGNFRWRTMVDLLPCGRLVACLISRLLGRFPSE